ncbi:MAG: alginate O-acetyltransferase AlgX-related protein [Pseudonocardiaceae bacterium]
MSVTERRAIDLHEAWLPQEHPLHRPRHGGRQLTALVCAALFFLTPTLSVPLGAGAAEFENRPLAPFPAITAGWGFFTGLEAWAADRLPFRDDAVRTYDVVSRGVFGEPAPFTEQGAPAEAQPGPVDPVPAPADRDRIPLSAFPAVIEGKDGWLYLGSYVRGACAPSRSLDGVIASLHELRDAVERSGRRFELVVAPDKTTMVPELMPEEYVGDGCVGAARAEFWRRAVPAVGAIDLRPALRDAAARKGGSIYYPADTHWSHEGGLVLTYALAGSIEPGVSRTWQISRNGSIPWPDDISPLIGRNGEHRIDTYALAPDGGPDRTQPVVSDFRLRLELASPPTTGTIERPVRMVADSYTQFASRYLAAVFNDLSIVHPETVGAAPERAGELLAEGEVVVVEIAERHLMSGESQILRDPVIDTIGAELARRPVR